METKQPKKLLILYILDILRKYSDENHRLSQTDIIERLRNEYSMSADRKAIRRNILDLIDFGYDIEYSEVTRTVKNKLTGDCDDSAVMTDFYLNREFTDSELHLMEDLLVFSNYVPHRQRAAIVKKLENLSGIYFRSRAGYMSVSSNTGTDNKQIFLNIETLDEAISLGKKVCFNYLEYHTDKKLHPRTRSDGSEIYIISPYQFVSGEGKYYVICNNDKYENVSNYRIDRMKDIRILEDKSRPFETLVGADGKPLRLQDYVKKNVYMYSGVSCGISLRICKTLVSDVIDIFGKDISFSDEDDDFVTVHMIASENAAEQFVFRFSPRVTVLSPQSLADTVRARLTKTLALYEK